MNDRAVAAERDDTRGDGPMTGSPLAVILHWIELYRETVLLKAAGLNSEQLCEASAAPSKLTLIGIVRHLTEVESYWVRVVLGGNEETPDLYCTPEYPDGDFDNVSPATALADLAAYEREITATSELLANWTDLEATAKGTRRGKAVNVGWILTHLIEEYARHVGHMDLLRERIDNRTGY